MSETLYGASFSGGGAAAAQTAASQEVIVDSIAQVASGFATAIAADGSATASMPDPPSVLRQDNQNNIGGGESEIKKDLKHPSTPVGRSGNPINVVSKNKPQIIDGTKFTGHALDRMQERGIISPRTVLDVVKNPDKTIPGSSIGTTAYIKANLKVVTNQAGDIITVMFQK